MTAEERPNDHFTVVFEGDLRALPSNPIHIGSPFGKVVAIAYGDALSFDIAGERLRAMNEGIKIGEASRDAAEKEAYADGLKHGRQEAHRAQVEFEANRDRECPTFPGYVSGLDIDFREVGEPILELRMTAKQAEQLEAGLSDLLCWARGFNAALYPDHFDRSPMGIEAVRTIRESITKAQRAAEKAKSA